eukprot:7909549-Ditylum_brightwellii.AAC.1
MHFTGLKDNTLGRFFHGNQTCVHCLGKILANYLSQFPPLTTSMYYYLYGKDRTLDGANGLVGVDPGWSGERTKVHRV